MRILWSCPPLYQGCCVPVRSGSGRKRKLSLACLSVPRQSGVRAKTVRVGACRLIVCACRSSPAGVRNRLVGTSATGGTSLSAFFRWAWKSHNAGQGPRRHVEIHQPYENLINNLLKPREANPIRPSGQPPLKPHQNLTNTSKPN